MIPGLGTFLDRLDSLLGKNYLIAGFVPVLVFAVFGGWILYLLHPVAVVEFLAEVTGEETLDQTVSWLALTFVVGLTGYVVWSLNATFRELLEGRYLPLAARRWLEAQQQVARSKLNQRLAELRPDRVRYRMFAGLDIYEAVDNPAGDKAKERQWVNQLAVASEKGLNSAAGMSGSTETLPKRLVSLFDQLKDAQERRQIILFTKAEELFSLLELELKNGPERHLLRADFKQLSSMADVFPDIARYALSRIESEYDRVWSQKFFRFPNESNTLGPTAMANMAELHRNYGKQRYGMEIDLIWPRMQALITEDGAFSALIVESKLKLDFSVSMTAMSGLFALSWIVPVALYAENFYLVPLVPAVALGAMVLFYLLAVRAYRALGEVLRSAIDIFRFELMDKLHLEKPADSNIEKKTWHNLCDHMMLTATKVLEYRQDDSGG